MLSKARKLKGRSPEELRVRAAQALAAFAERRGWSAQARVPADAELRRLLDPARFGAGSKSVELDDAALLDHFRRRAAPRFFFAPDARPEIVAEFRRRYDTAAEQSIVERAERAAANSFDLLGLEDLRFGAEGDAPDWHFEPVSGKRAPGDRHWSRVAYLDPEVSGDKKFTWEINRHQYFATLGQAYWLTGDERHAATFARHLASWMDANPPKQGINWASSLEVAFRPVSWLWALHFFRDSEHLTPTLFARTLKFLYLHARHLETYLSTYFSPNTHLTGEALGLVYIGMLLPEFRDAARWRETGERILNDALLWQVRADGVYFEQASCYHRYTTDFYLHLVMLKSANGEHADDAVLRKLAALLDHLMYITTPEGRTPLFGDDDGGRLVHLAARSMDDSRPTLACGAMLLHRGDYKAVAASDGRAPEELLWLAGVEGPESFDRLRAHAPVSRSQAFPAGGYYVMRDGWDRAANYMLIDCGPHGTANCGHAHADALAFSLSARGRGVLVDPGTYTYTGSTEARDHFRRSAAHNTLTVDGESSSAPAGAFRWDHVANCFVRAWVSRERFDFFDGEHDGFLRLARPATHRRAVLFLKNDYFVVRDRVAGDGERLCRVHFHLDPDAAPRVEEAAARERPRDRAGVELFAFARAGDGQARGAWRASEDWVSPCYGRRERATALLFEARTRGDAEIVSFVVPRGAGERSAQVREAEAIGGRAFELTYADERGVRDVLILCGGEAGTGIVESADARTDFSWAWLRLRDGELAEAVLIGGSRLTIGGIEIINLPATIDFAVARRDDDEILIELSTKERRRSPAARRGEAAGVAED